MIDMILQRVMQAQQTVLLDTLGEFQVGANDFRLVRRQHDATCVFVIPAADDNLENPVIAFNKATHLADDLSYWKVVTPSSQDSNLSLEGGRWFLYSGVLRTRTDLGTTDFHAAMQFVAKSYIETFGYGVSKQ
ncbi:hypothetical protein [Cupriavidus campinensis]|uniref:Uncharacterized protein n=1 Tax=Cupriavidus campinensis TaxID=151783 RepID=A0ABY3ESV7_9BURK|nr:hypothetical protein [Cupriavidus campinensis]TSP14055.1 hypothetical protein FGG12_06185 [Cupriavidus campinensis]